MGLTTKGWRNESLRHSEAKRFGKASGGKVTAPKGVPKRNGSGKGTRANKGRGGCDPIRINPNVVDISNKKISSKEAVAFHNVEARKSLAKNNYTGYRYHTKEAIKINEKAMLLKMKKKS